MFWGDDGIVPGVVRELLHDDSLEWAEADLLRVGVLGAVVVELRVPSDAWDLPESVESLKAVTIIGGTNDPRTEGAERPWLCLLGHLLRHDAEGAAHAARAWYGALVTASVEVDDPVPFRAVSAYLVAVIAAAIGRDGMADYWLTVGQVEAEADGDIWTAFISAVRFVRAALRSP